MGVAWPSGVPMTPEASGTTGGPQSAVASFQPDIGPSIDRSRSTMAPEVWSVRLQPMTFAEFAIFKAWHKDDLLNGVRAFDWDHPLTKVSQEWRFIRATPAYSITPVQGHLLNVAFRVIEVPT